MTQTALHAQANKPEISTVSRKRFSQRVRLMWLFADWPDPGWVPLPAILNLRIANYRARISELRKQGQVVELKDEWINGQRKTWYRLARNSNGN